MLQKSGETLSPPELAAYGRKLFSQGDEDGVIAEIFQRIGTIKKTFIEFGAETGQENNTRWLLEQGWRGLWIEANPLYARRIRSSFRRFIRSGHLVFIEAAVTAENINHLISSCDLPTDVDFLSIDIDGNDYYVLEAVSAARPRAICVEYSTSRPPPIDWVMAYDPSYRWNGGDDCSASLVAMERLARSKGYALVATTAHSANAFFVRDDLIADRFSGPFTPERFFRSVAFEDIGNYPRTMPPSAKLRFQVRLYAFRSRLRLRKRAAALAAWFSALLTR